MKLIHIGLLGMLALAAGQTFAADFHIGDRVSCNWKNGGAFYDGRVVDKEGDKLFIHYNDGDKEHTVSSQCRHLEKTSAAGPLMQGSQVECRWKNGSTWYPGVIAEKTGNQVFIHYNDGDKENTTLSKCRSR